MLEQIKMMSSTTIILAVLGLGNALATSYLAFVEFRNKKKNQDVDTDYLEKQEKRVTLFPTNAKEASTFYHELKQAERKFVENDIRGGAQHLAKAISLCSESHRARWYKVLREMLEEKLFEVVEDEGFIQF